MQIKFRSPIYKIVVAIIFATGLICISPHVLFAQSNLTPEQEAQLRAELASIESQIQDQQNILNTKKSEGASLERDVAILNAQIKQAQLKIKAHEISINKLGKDINQKTETIRNLSGKIDSSKISLAEMLQRTREMDDYSVVEALLANQDISEFFVDVDSYANIKQSLGVQLDDIRVARSQNEQAKKDLDHKRTEEIDLKSYVVAEQEKIKKAEEEKKRLLTLNKNEQLNYQTVIQNKQKRAQEIKSALFRLRDVEAIKFGDAVTYAKQASAKTGVRAAFILAILQQESNLGANVGRCFLSNPETGEGVFRSSGATVKNVMKPSRDVQPFLEITKSLGRDPYKTPISCPLSIGFGGAMGPAQFIPSTWQIFSERIAASNGRGIADPWVAEDAFMASAFYLADLGAASQSYSAERNAACRYYSGRSCKGSNTFYGDQVMARVKTLQDNIDILQSL